MGILILLLRLALINKHKEIEFHCIYDFLGCFLTLILLPIFNVVNDSRIFFFGYSDFDKIISILLPIPTGFFISFLIVGLIIKTLNLIKDGFEK